MVEAGSWAVQFISIPIPAMVPRTPFLDLPAVGAAHPSAVGSALFGFVKRVLISVASVNEKPPKTIATINFKGGVGKTTVTWCLGDLISTYADASTLLFDLDAQMSLTQAITLNDRRVSTCLRHLEA